MRFADVVTVTPLGALRQLLIEPVDHIRIFRRMGYTWVKKTGSMPGMPGAPRISRCLSGASWRKFQRPSAVTMIFLINARYRADAIASHALCWMPPNGQGGGTRARSARICGVRGAGLAGSMISRPLQRQEMDETQHQSAEAVGLLPRRDPCN
jgi:hypothetical protein